MAKTKSKSREAVMVYLDARDRALLERLATTLVCTMKFASKQARDDAISTGMTDGMEFSYARLDEMCKVEA